MQTETDKFLARTALQRFFRPCLPRRQVFTPRTSICFTVPCTDKTTQADAIRAYVQTTLKSKHLTYVRIPPALQPASWKGKYREPYCRLVKALYGHPESRGHWERHLQKALLSCRAKPVQNHPSSFWFATERLLLTIYVVGLLLSGPATFHNPLWRQLSRVLSFDPPEELDVFLGRKGCVQRYDPATLDSRRVLTNAGVGGA